MAKKQCNIWLIYWAHHQRQSVERLEDSEKPDRTLEDVVKTVVDYKITDTRFLVQEKLCNIRHKIELDRK
ncbi:hypothetical protein ABEB36_014270 [Hypothenemus hampei]|uniref:Uncharacterized protein n=1 Tax=Hypothenemus hampei TaxID=57062 RepID=A0ABD1E3X3_HYPHA